MSDAVAPSVEDYTATEAPRTLGNGALFFGH
jgi:hypothetical protein